MEYNKFSYLPNDIWLYIKTFILYDSNTYNRIEKNRKKFYKKKILFGINMIQNIISNKKRELYTMSNNRIIQEYSLYNGINLNKLLTINWKYKLYNLFDKLLILDNKYKFPRNYNELLIFKNYIERNYYLNYSYTLFDFIVNNEINNENYNAKIIEFQKKIVKNNNLVYL